MNRGESRDGRTSSPDRSGPLHGMEVLVVVVSMMWTMRPTYLLRPNMNDEDFPNGATCSRTRKPEPHFDGCQSTKIPPNETCIASCILMLSLQIIMFKRKIIYINYGIVPDCKKRCIYIYLRERCGRVCNMSWVESERLLWVVGRECAVAFLPHFVLCCMRRADGGVDVGGVGDVSMQLGGMRLLSRKSLPHRTKFSQPIPAVEAPSQSPPPSGQSSSTSQSLQIRNQILHIILIKLRMRILILILILPNHIVHTMLQNFLLIVLPKIKRLFLGHGHRIVVFCRRVCDFFFLFEFLARFFFFRFRDGFRGGYMHSVGGKELFPIRKMEISAFLLLSPLRFTKSRVVTPQSKFLQYSLPLLLERSRLLPDQLSRG
ncbi:uncharacterized protein EV422DRAFT_172240 [Fimicolochytrium jonesii]|uniref:uncharacterized protein n=1 Tax=Fimicolochytrium jonesii TaxID=1396493 RepID=UPI0022FE05A9|nr:uncharacterized protein EV422DRAFT_172240 [Fimicolochytrium jonesii]KAI8818563.1 hypothetical protein EV422DRAFT_172240 [Fimicolochytrium jonesii]